MNKIIDIFSNPEFHDSISVASDFTRENQKEAAFCVYSKPDLGFEVSRVHKGRSDSGDQEQDELQEKIAKIEDDIFNSGEYLSIDVGPLIHETYSDGTLKDTLRKNILLNAHTHPIIRISKFGSLSPSIADLEISEEIEQSNPGHISAIIVPEQGISIASLLVYRRNPNERFVPRYQMYNVLPGFPKVLGTLHDSGFLATKVEFDTEKNNFTGESYSKLEELEIG